MRILLTGHNGCVGSIMTRVLAYDIDYLASVKLAQAAKDAGVKNFLPSSSCSMYRAAGDDAWRGRTSLPT